MGSSAEGSPASGAARPDVAAIKAAWEAFEAEGPEAAMEQLLAISREDVELRPYAAEGRVLRGAEELRRFFRELRDSGGSVRARPQSFAVEGDTVVVRGSIRVTRADGSFAETKVRWRYRFEGGRLREVDWAARPGD